MTDSPSSLPQQTFAPSVGLQAISTGQLTSIRLRLLQAEEQLRSGEWRKAQEHLLTARSLLDRSGVPVAPAPPRGGLTLRQMQRLQLYIEQHLDCAITLTELAQLLGLSYSHFCRVFSQSFGEPPLAYVRTRRVERAKELMLSDGLPLSVVALECGLSDQAVLCKLFRRVTGETPAAWRRSQRA
jgi:AraC family transcriptional regulator